MIENRMFSKLRRMLSDAMRWADDLLFPEGATCLICECASEREMEDGICSACSRVLDAQQARMEQIEATYHRPAADGISYVRAAFPYEDPAKRLIRMLKYDSVRIAAKPLIRTMMTLDMEEADLIVPVPTTKLRQRERGYNQAEVLAQGIAEAIGIEMEAVLERTGEQAAQSRLSGKRRTENLNGCMHAKRRLDGRKILLIDDVYTTGSTAKEAARALLEAGAASVGMIAAARSLPESELPEFLRERR